MSQDKIESRRAFMKKLGKVAVGVAVPFAVMPKEAMARIGEYGIGGGEIRNRYHDGCAGCTGCVGTCEGACIRDCYGGCRFTCDRDCDRGCEYTCRYTSER